MFRLRDTSVSGFPRLWLLTRMPCRRTCSALVTPDVRISRIRRSPIPRTAGVRTEWTDRRHRHQAQRGPLPIPGGSFRGTEGPLTPPAPRPEQTLAHRAADLPERLPGVTQREVFPLAFPVSVDLPHEHGDRREAPGWAGPLPQLLAFSGQRFRRRLPVQVATVPAQPVPHLPIPVAQKVQPGSLRIQVHHPRFVPVELPTQPVLPHAFHPSDPPRPLVTGPDDQSSSPGELHPQALTEPDGSLATHPALLTRPKASCPPLVPPDCSVDQVRKRGEWAPSLHAHYRHFHATTSPSAPVPRIGTQVLGGPPLGLLP